MGNAKKLQTVNVIVEKNQNHYYQEKYFLVYVFTLCFPMRNFILMQSQLFPAISLHIKMKVCVLSFHWPQGSSSALPITKGSGMRFMDCAERLIVDHAAF